MTASAVRAQTETVRAAFRDRPTGLVRHVERVVAEAVALAKRWDADPQRAALAAWGHDLFRALPPGKQLKLAREVGVTVTTEDEHQPVLLHGPNAAAVLRQRFAVSDEDALAAVRDHTLGAPEMPLLAKIILIADKVERRKRRRTPVMGEIRRLARRDLDLALLCWADWKWVEERTRGWDSHSQHWGARQRWVAEHHAEIGLPPRTEFTPAEWDLESTAPASCGPVHDAPRQLPPVPPPPPED